MGLPYTWRELERALGELDEEVVDYSALDTITHDIQPEDDLYESQKRRGLSYTRRQVAAYERIQENRDLSELRAFVRDQIGGRNELWPLIKDSSMPYSKRQLERVLRELSDEVVDYAALDTIARDIQLDDDLFEIQKQRGLSYTRRQVAEYDRMREDRDLSELRTFARDQVGGRDELWLLIKDANMPYSWRELERILRELSDEVVDYSALDTIARDIQPDDDLFETQKQRGLS